VLEWLKANPGWLLILDNVDTPQALTEAEKLVGQLAGGQVLMTSRLANFPADVRPLDLDLLSADDAADFLLERTAEGRRAAADDGAKARELAVDGLGGSRSRWSMLEPTSSGIGRALASIASSGRTIATRSSAGQTRRSPIIRAPSRSPGKPRWRN
jgi:hypothetical protein